MLVLILFMCVVYKYHYIRTIHPYVTTMLEHSDCFYLSLTSEVADNDAVLFLCLSESQSKQDAIHSYLGALHCLLLTFTSQSLASHYG